jgi:hypothetical protein
MTQLPLLVNQLLDWYIWKEKINQCNREYSEIVDFESTSPDGMVRNLIHKDNFILHNFQYRAMPFVDIFIHNFTYHSRVRVAILPQKYFYSSGRTSRRGYVSLHPDVGTKKINSWLPDFSL